MADEIAVGDWVVSVSTSADGGLTVAVSRDAEPYATLVVPDEAASPEGERRRKRKLKRDMDF